VILNKRNRRGNRLTNKTIGLNVRGRSYPEIYRVSVDVFVIVTKMLATNQAIDPFSRYPRFGIEEVQFILELLGVPIRAVAEVDCSMADLRISEG